jgi:glycerol kinase
LPGEPTAVALALDLGTTRVKAARVDARGCLFDLAAVAAPVPAGDGAVREVDPAAYRAAAEEALDRVAAGTAGDLPVGIASQRSSFLLWERDGGRPVTPIVSWQDRRAAAWCDRRRERGPDLAARTGLLLSPHYLGPKLASMLEADPDLRARAESGELRAGTLDAWLGETWGGDAGFRTDPTMAARTLLVELGVADWSDALLEETGVPRALLPVVGRSEADPVALPGRGRLTASLADQAAGLLAATGGGPRLLVNLGTGCFVLVPTGEAPRPTPGYLAGPCLAPADGPARYALEGTVNAGGAEADRHAPGPTDCPARDPAPDAFCLPDAAGVGAPYWRPEMSRVLSPAARALDDAGRRRVVLEGLLFRVRGILEDLGGAEADAVLLAGGLARDPFVAEGLAACLDRPIVRLDDPESTLAGAGRLAAGVLDLAGAGSGGDAGETIEPADRSGWLRGKYERWREWLPSALAGEEA